MATTTITIIGAGLAGCEAAWQAAGRGLQVRLVEMKPQRLSPAHESPDLGELVCSNSLRSDDPTSAVGLLKEEMRRLDSLVLRVAEDTRVPAGKALAVDRKRFSAAITLAMEEHPRIVVEHREVMEIPPDDGAPLILATGPLTTEALAASLVSLTGGDNLAFYDAIAPIIDGESLDYDIVYRKSRWDDEGPGDYLNCPMNREEYGHFISLLGEAKKVPLRDFENPKYFEGCLPIEVMLERGDETLRFGPMKPVGLRQPGSNLTPHAVVQLRAEDREGCFYNMVGFQTKLTWPEQQRVFRAIPGMARAEFARYGSIHRNTFVKAPEVLLPTLGLRRRPGLLLAGQLSGVEGYVESAAMGLLAGINAATLAQGRVPLPPPPETALGALIHHLIASDSRHFQPSNVTFGLFPPLEGKTSKKERGARRAAVALAALEKWRGEFPRQSEVNC